MLTRFEETRAEVQEATDGFIGMWSIFASAFPGADLMRQNGLAVTWPDVPFTLYNNVFQTEPIDDVSSLRNWVHFTASLMRKKPFPGMVIVCQELLRGAALMRADAIFRSQGFSIAIELTAMIKHVVPSPLLQRSSLKIERVKHGLDVTELNCLAHGIPVDAGSKSMLPSEMWQNAFTYVGYEGGRAVTTATTFVVGSCLYVALVATLPEARRKGFATAVIKRSLSDASQATGISRTLLHATPTGRLVAASLGYYPIAEYTCYVMR